MWAHYADNAKGFVVEFSDLFSVFTGDDTGILRTPIDIEYTNDRIGVTFDPRSHKSMFFTKFEDWNYEVEVRVILPLKDCHKEIHNGSEMHIFTIPKRCIKRLILGWKMPQSDVDAIQKYISVHNPQVELAHAKFVRSKIQIAPGS